MSDECRIYSSFILLHSSFKMITSAKNTRIVEARKLTQRKHRRRQNRFLVEGLQLLSIAMEVRQDSPKNAARIEPLELFYNEALFTGETAPRLLAQLTEAGAIATAVAPNVLNTLSERDTSQGLTATFSLNKLEYPFDHLQSKIVNPKSTLVPAASARKIPGLILILDKLQDPGNLGTLIRTADAVGVDAIILLEPCVDPFDPKTVRGTMGSIFTVPFTRVDSIDVCLPQLTAMGYRPVGADGTLGRAPWQSENLLGSVALVLGNEARGLSPELHPHLTDYVSLPLRGHAESLNVSIAGGALMYEWLRVNEPKLSGQ